MSSIYFRINRIRQRIGRDLLKYPHLLLVGIALASNLIYAGVFFRLADLFKLYNRPLLNLGDIQHMDTFA